MMILQLKNGLSEGVQNTRIDSAGDHFYLIERGPNVTFASCNGIGHPLFEIFTLNADKRAWDMLIDELRATADLLEQKMLARQEANRNNATDDAGEASHAWRQAIGAAR